MKMLSNAATSMCLLVCSLFHCFVGKGAVPLKNQPYRTFRLRSLDNKPSISASITLVHGLPIVEVSVNGHSHENFLLDSGSENTVLNSDDARRLGIALSEDILRTGPGIADNAGAPMRAAKSVKLDIGNKTVFRGDLFAIDLEGISTKLALHVSGIIGYDVLSAHRSVVDYVHRRFEIYPNSGRMPGLGVGGLVIEVMPTNRLPVVTALISILGNECGQARVSLDTGAESALLIFSPFSNAHGLPKLPGWHSVIGTGHSGTYLGLKGLSGSVTLSGRSIEVANVGLSLATRGLAGEGSEDALIGSPIFQDHILFFDVRRGRIVLI